MALTWEFCEPGSVFDEGEQRTVYTRKARGTGIVAAPPNDAAMIHEIYNDPGLPARGAALDATLYPTLKVVSRRLDSIECQNNQRVAYMTLVYKNQSLLFSTVPDDDGPVVVTITSGLVAVQTSEDKDGNLITTKHNGQTKAASVDLLVPVSNIECQRIEENNPLGRADSVTGRVNDGLWNGYAARTVLCQEIESVTDDDGESFDVIYRFAYRPETWDQTVIHTNPDGSPVTNPVTSPTSEAGLKTVEIYKDTDFGVLDISF